MEPNAPAANNQNGSDPLDFIMKSEDTNKAGSKLPLGSLSNKAKLIIAGVGGFFLILIGFSLYGMFFSTPENSLLLSSVGRQQSEILQAAELGVEKARGQAARNLAITTKLSLIDDQKSLVAALGDKNVKVSTKDDPELEQRLITAEQANRFDEELTAFMETELTSYARNLQAAYNTTAREDKELREVLAAQYKNARFLAGLGHADQEQQN